jgi:hypothetical protein
MRRRKALKKCLIFGTSVFSFLAFSNISVAQKKLSSFNLSTNSNSLTDNSLIAKKTNLVFPPIPEENPETGLNSNAHLPGNPESTMREKEAFIEEINQYALPFKEKYGIPTGVITAIAIVESHFGRTRVAYYANNLFKIKYINLRKGRYDGSWENIKTYQLVGQSNEAPNTAVLIKKNYGDDNKLVLDQARRFDNRYRVFNTYQECVDFLVNDLWLKDEYYKAAIEKYKTNIIALGRNNAAKQLGFDLGMKKLNSTAINAYQSSIAKIIDEWKLSQSNVSLNGRN